MLSLEPVFLTRVLDACNFHDSGESMYRSSIVLTAAVLISAVGACAEKSGSIRWEGSIEEALALSASDGNPVMLYFTFVG